MTHCGIPPGKIHGQPPGTPPPLHRFGELGLYFCTEGYNIRYVERVFWCGTPGVVLSPPSIFENHNQIFPIDQLRLKIDIKTHLTQYLVNFGFPEFTEQ